MQVRHLVLAGLLAASLVGSAQANFLRGRSKCCASDPCCPTACCPTSCTRTVNCVEWVQEQRQVCCTSYRMEQRQEQCTGYRCETYMEPRTRTVCCTRKITEQCMETRTVCERVACWTEKTVMKERCVTQQVTEMRTKCVDNGHWECRETTSLSARRRSSTFIRRRPFPAFCRHIPTRDSW